MSDNSPKNPNQARLYTRVEQLSQSISAASYTLPRFNLGREGADRETARISLKACRAHLAVAMRRLAAVDEAMDAWDRSEEQELAE